MARTKRPSAEAAYFRGLSNAYREAAAQAESVEKAIQGLRWNLNRLADNLDVAARDWPRGRGMDASFPWTKGAISPPRVSGRQRKGGR